jgi:hypothetical protein
MSQDSFDRFDEMAERTIWPWVDDAGQEWDVEDSNYDDHDDFFEDFEEEDEDESMDGDHESALGSAGWGENEYYGDYGDDGDW